MPLGTIDRTPPPFFRQGASPLSKLLVLSALSVLLMVLDVRLRVAQPLRAVVATALYPVQVAVLQPMRAAQWVGQYFSSLAAAQDEAARARAELTRQAQRATLVEHLSQENHELRQLLGMQSRLPAPAQGAEVLYELADPYARKLMLNRGHYHGITEGAAVMDGYGVLGQITRVYPLTAEVTLLIDRNQTTPVLNTRTGLRSLAQGLPQSNGGQIELRFVQAHADTQAGDILTTSGVDGVYPPGLPVAKVLSVTNQGNAGFAQVLCQPLARPSHAMHVLVVTPQSQATVSEPQP